MVKRKRLAAELKKLRNSTTRPREIKDDLNSPARRIVSENPDVGQAEDAVRTLLRFMGEDPKRGGLLETPARYVKALMEYGSGYDKDPASVLKVFKDGGESYDEMVFQRDIPVHSHCEHHMAPFFGVAHIGYLPNKKIVGLSKLFRLTDIFSRRLQVQERLTVQIAKALWDHLKPKGVGVVLECRHLCMECRGVKIAGTETVTSKLMGAMFTPAARAEFLGFVHAK
jgi:GTP cyclohydrolase IA